MEDDMLDHPKWRRALRDGGDAALTVWWRLCSWCARRLTDGEVPADMVEEIAQSKGSKTRSKALRALVEASLLARRCDGGVSIVDYLERNPSRSEVEQERGRRASSQRNRRSTDRVTGHAGTSDPERNEVPSQSHPNPIPSQEEKSSSSVDPPSVPGLARVAPVECQGERMVWRSLEGWDIPEELYAYSETAGLPRDRLRFRVDRLREGPIGGKRGVFDRFEHVKGLIPTWKTWEESDRAKAIGVTPTWADGKRKHGSAQPNAGKDGWEGQTVLTLKDLENT
jgi:hypothetical protein